MRYKNIIFDFDGTLTKTNEIYAREFVKLGNAYGFNDTYEDAFLWISRYSIPYAMHRHQWGPDYKERYVEYRQMRNKSVLEEAVPIEGVRNLLEHIALNRGRSFLYTDNNSVAYKCLEKWDLKQFFSDAIFCSEKGLPLKPSSDGLLYLMEKNKLDPTDCVVVGDRDADIISGTGAKVDGILFDPYGYYPELNAKFRVTDLMDVIEILGS